MGKRGPAQAPTSLKLVRGDRKSRINTDEPRPAGVVAPVCELGPAEREVWDRMAPDLVRQRVLTSNDCQAFTEYCIVAATLHAAWAEVRVTGMWNEKGRAPAWHVAMDSLDRLLRIGARFGLTPSDRSQLSVPNDETSAHPAEAYLT